MLMEISKFVFKLALFSVGVGLLLVLVPRLVTALHASGRIYSVEDVPANKVALVFGAGLTRSGAPTRVLRDRVETAAHLYLSDKVNKLLMSGDNRFVDYNEPQAMKDYALDLGVPEDAIVLDYAGRRTYDTCYRARAIFQVEEAILVTQSFHLPRALYTCSQLGLNASGVAATNHYFLKRSRAYWNLRELLATPMALWEVHISKPLPVLGDPEPIFRTDTPPGGES